MLSRVRTRVRTRTIAFMAAALVLCFFTFNRRAAGKQSEKKTESQLVGTWMLVDMHNEKNVEVLGPHPSGMLVFDAAGHYSSQVMRSDLPKFASPDRTKATLEESQTVIRGSMALFGTYTVRDPGTIALHIQASLFPNWDGAEQLRAFVLKGDELELTNLTNSFGSGSVHAFWKRVSPAR